MGQCLQKSCIEPEPSDSLPIEVSTSERSQRNMANNNRTRLGDGQFLSPPPLAATSPGTMGRRGLYRKLLRSAAIPPAVTVTMETPMSQVSGSRRQYLNSINTVPSKENVVIPKLNVGLFVLERLRDRPADDRAFAIFDNGRWQSCGDMVNRIVLTLSIVRRECQLNSGEVALCLASNSIRFPPLFLACNLLRVRLAVLNPKLARDACVLGELEQLNVAAVFSALEHADSAQHIRSLLDIGKPVFFVDQSDGPFGKLVADQHLADLEKNTGSLDGALDQLCNSDMVDGEQAVEYSTEVAFVFFSMGRTDPLHTVLLSHQNLLAAILQFESGDVNVLPVGATVLGLLPLYHPFALTVQLYHCLASGSSLVLLPKIDPLLLLRAIHCYQVSVCVAVPPLVEYLATAGGVVESDLSSLKAILTTLGPLSAPMVDRLYKRFPDLLLYNGYGSVETSGLTHVTNGSRLLCMSIGRPLPNVTCKIQHLRRDVALQKKKRGELCLVGPQIALSVGLACAADGNNNNNNNLAHTPHCFLDKYGWLRTGDWGLFDEEAMFYVCGTVDRSRSNLEVTSCKKSNAGVVGVFRRVENVQNVGMTPLKATYRKVPLTEGKGKKTNHLPPADCLNGSPTSAAPQVLKLNEYLLFKEDTECVGQRAPAPQLPRNRSGYFSDDNSADSVFLD